MKTVFFTFLALMAFEAVTASEEVKIDKCDVCTWIVAEIDKILETQETEDAILEALSGLCNSLDGLLPGTGDICMGLIEANIEAIIDGLVNNQLSPATICGNLGLCAK